MHPEVAELQPKLKEILYDCAVEIKATKAALYLYDITNRFELAAEYGFKPGARPFADFNDPVVDRCGRGRTPFFINGVAAEPRFSDVLFSAQTDRMLVAPMYLRGKLVGIIDMRDKAAKANFDQADIPKAQTIAERMAAVFAAKNVFGQRFITLSGRDEDSPQQAPAAPVAAPAPPAATPPPPAAPPVAAPPLAAPPLFTPVQPRPAAPPPPAQPQPAPPAGRVPRLATLVIEARTLAGRVLVPSANDTLTESDLVAAREVLKSFLHIPGVVAAMLSAYGHGGGMQEIAARSTLTDEARNVLQSKLNVWLTKRGEGGGVLRTNVNTPLGTSGPAITATQFQKVFTAPVIAGPYRGLYLTAAFANAPERNEHELLAALLQYLQTSIEQAPVRDSLSTLRLRAAEKLLEPDFAKYPELRSHTDAVIRSCEQFGRYLGFSASELETLHVFALVHDAGMRLLDYDRLYPKRDLTGDELNILREHVAVGAAIAEPILGSEVARLVLCHHERVDGRGYPNELHADEIPLLCRVLQLCDAWAAITDPQSYQTPESPEHALAAITRGAGSQFDATLAAKFVEMMRGR